VAQFLSINPDDQGSCSKKMKDSLLCKCWFLIVVGQLKDGGPMQELFDEIWCLFFMMGADKMASWLVTYLSPP